MKRHLILLALAALAMTLAATRWWAGSEHENRAARTSALPRGEQRARRAPASPRTARTVQFPTPSSSAAQPDGADDALFIEGRVIDSAGEAVEGARVFVAAVPGLTAISGAEGDFRLDGLVEGGYAIEARTADGQTGQRELRLDAETPFVSVVGLKEIQSV